MKSHIATNTPSRPAFFKKWTSLSLFALSASLAVTPITASAQSLPEHLMYGYWQNWSPGAIKLINVPTTYDVIAIAFAIQDSTPGEASFALDPGVSSQLGGYTQADFIADIAAVKARGQHVIISCGGASGNIVVNSSASATNFANSVNALMSQYGFEGVDIDFESGINVTYLTQALRAIKSGSIITMAPQTTDVENTSSPYFALALNIKDILTICNTQYYNSGSMYGYDGKIYYEGTVDFITALATILLQDGLRPDQVGLGVPADSSAGSGYVTPSVVNEAFGILATGASGGTYRPPQTYPTLRGVMTWSINIDATQNYNMANTVSAYLRSLGGGGGEGPFGGSPAAIPGTVQAENYDTGGQGVAYNVGSINGTDNGYRSDGVDLEATSDTGGGVDLGWTSGGQWFKYTVNVSTAGTYTVSFRVAGGQGAVTDAFHLSNSSGTNLSGNVNVPNTGGWQTWTTVTASVTLPVGQQVLTLNQDNGGWNLNYASFTSSVATVATPTFNPGGGTYSSAQNVTITSATGGASIRYTTDGSTPTSTTGTIYSGPVNISSTATLKAIAYESGFNNSAVASATYTISIGEGPFGGSPAAIPGTVQAENYDTGGQGVAYNVGSINGTDNGYRSDGVDLEATSDTGGGVDLGWTTGGQWFKYTVNVATAGTYTVSFRVAAPSAVTDAFHLSNSSGTNLSGSVNLPATGGYQTWITVTASVTLPAGQQILTLNQDNGGWNLNYASFASNASNRTLTGSSGNGWHALAISPAATGSFTATYDATPSVSPENAVVGLSNGAATAFGNLGCIARFNPSGDIDAYNGSGYAAASTIPYSAGVSYHFRLVVNVSAHTYSVYVTPSGGSELTVGANYAFRSSANTMTSLNDWNLYVDPSIGGASLTANNLTP